MSLSPMQSKFWSKTSSTLAEMPRSSLMSFLISSSALLTGFSVLRPSNRRNVQICLPDKLACAVRTPCLDERLTRNTPSSCDHALKIPLISHGRLRTGGPLFSTMSAMLPQISQRSLFLIKSQWRSLAAWRKDIPLLSCEHLKHSTFPDFVLVRQSLQNIGSESGQIWQDSPPFGFAHNSHIAHKGPSRIQPSFRISNFIRRQTSSAEIQSRESLPSWCRA